MQRDDPVPLFSVWTGAAGGFCFVSLKENDGKVGENEGTAEIGHFIRKYRGYSSL